MIKWLLVTVARIGRVKNWLGERQVSTLTALLNIIKQLK